MYVICEKRTFCNYKEHCTHFYPVRFTHLKSVSFFRDGIINSWEKRIKKGERLVFKTDNSVCSTTVFIEYKLNSMDTHT